MNVGNEKESLLNLLGQKKELDQSIKYASYIQKAILPTKGELINTFKNSFIFYQPRDVVSGDFYWVHKQLGKTIVAVGDCTGHGVPGAFLSILGISFLNLVVSKHNPSTPAQLLNFLREYMMKSLSQTGEAQEQKDGIDLSVCMLDLEKKELNYSGSFNPAYLIRNKELIQLDGNKMPVGIDFQTEEPFTNRKVKIEEDDTIYLFTDGFPDQFGGSNNKKYKYPAFRKLLTSCSNLPIEEQKEFLKTEFFKWKGILPQLDDTTIFGFKI